MEENYKTIMIADDNIANLKIAQNAFSHEEAVRIILEGKGVHFDPVLVDAFEQVA